MKYEQKAWALRNKDGIWLFPYSGRKLSHENLRSNKGDFVGYGVSPGDRIVRVKVTLEVADDAQARGVLTETESNFVRYHKECGMWHEADQATAFAIIDRLVALLQAKEDVCPEREGVSLAGCAVTDATGKSETSGAPMPPSGFAESSSAATVRVTGSGSDDTTMSHPSDPGTRRGGTTGEAPSEIEAVLSVITKALYVAREVPGELEPGYVPTEVKTIRAALDAAVRERDEARRALAVCEGR